MTCLDPDVSHVTRASLSGNKTKYMDKDESK